MKQKNVIKQIHPKGNGQAVLYLSMIDLEEFNLKVGFKLEFEELLDAYLQTKIDAKQKGYDENAFKFKDFKDVYIASLTK